MAVALETIPQGMVVDLPIATAGSQHHHCNMTKDKVSDSNHTKETATTEVVETKMKLGLDCFLGRGGMAIGGWEIPYQRVD